MLKKLYVNKKGDLSLWYNIQTFEAGYYIVETNSTGEVIYYIYDFKSLGLEFVDYFIDAPLPRPSLSTKVSTFFKEIFQEL